MRIAVVGNSSFIGSQCYIRKSRCNQALIVTVSKGAYPARISCVSCSPFFVLKDEVRIFDAI